MPAEVHGQPTPDWASRLEVRLVRPDERDRWRTLMAAHHYLGFRGLVGEALYYVACLDEAWVALLGWAAAAWMCRPRDQWIGWTRPQQWARLRFVVNNARFLILPGIHIFRILPRKSWRLIRGGLPPIGIRSTAILWPSRRPLSTLPTLLARPIGRPGGLDWGRRRDLGDRGIGMCIMGIPRPSGFVRYTRGCRAAWPLHFFPPLSKEVV